MLKPITISVDARDVLKALRQIRMDDVPFVVAYALTKTGQDIKAAERRAMQSVFDRPTKYALNALQLKPATKADPTAVVDFRYFGGTPAERYLGPHVENGGRRSHKSHEKALIARGIMRSDEYAVPGSGVALDQYGNMRGSLLTRILSQLGAAEQAAGYSANMTGKSRKRNVRRAGGRYFVMRGRSAPDGVYQRTADRSIAPVLIFVRAPRYGKRFPFYQIGRDVFADRFVVHARDGWSRAMRSRARAA